jgi:trk system potassium uptake protein TrkA
MKFLIIGCGRVGSTLTHTLSDRGHSVTVIDRDPHAILRLGPRFLGHTLIGTGFDRGLLLRAGIERCDGLAAVTGSDEVNVVAAQLARHLFRVPKAVARVYDPRKADLYRRFGIQTLNPITWGSNRIAELLSYSQLDTIVSLGTGEVDIVETAVPRLWIGRTVSAVTIPSEVHIAAITRRDHTFLPTSGTVFHEGDIIHVIVPALSAERFKGIFGAQ